MSANKALLFLYLYGRIFQWVPTGSEDLRAGLEPHGLAELDACVLGEQLGGHAAEGTQHSPASVDHLGLAVPAVMDANNKSEG